MRRDPLAIPQGMITIREWPTIRPVMNWWRSTRVAALLGNETPRRWSWAVGEIWA